MPQIQKQEKSPEKKLNAMEATKLPDAEFKTMVIKILMELRERMEESSENLNKVIIKLKRT